MKQTSSIELTDESFKRISIIANNEAGIQLPENKKSFVFSRLLKRIRHMNLKNFEEYCDIIEEETDIGHKERLMFITFVTTNVTHFFREDHHFEYLESTLKPAIMKRARAGEKIRIWSAGCSTGQEAISIAMCFLKDTPDISKYDIKILGTDIDAKAIKTAEIGVYSNKIIPSGYEQAFTKNSTACDNDTFQINENIRNITYYRRLNLLEDWPFQNSFDIIFCRNVTIYFNPNTQNNLFVRFSKYLKPNGTLFVGHSERAPVHPHGPYKSAGVTTYKLYQKD